MKLAILVPFLVANAAWPQSEPVLPANNPGAWGNADDPGEMADSRQHNNLADGQTPRAADRVAYKVTGNRDVRPAAIHDDGARTYIQWESSQAMPAVFAVDHQGHEEIVNGYMRGETFTLDRIYERLVFRIDDAVATARRIGAKSK
ncbi:TrbG/VirB9 family P-type conjugative transfer protein [Sphingobium sp. SJ10-10]|uniref:TrbG/VirB9 family P-type conjugative transfer protein n=1 Tax=Sphingobium sp. SJ10-10 TaxID=3114999 RepID=UPI002E189BF2|nr:TrbG/VirB9 family P-type conjugative transfer protein [Sphingobium sp. SJ10-10]